MLDSFITVALSVSNSVTADLTPFNPRPFVSEQTHFLMTCNAQFVLWGLETVNSTLNTVAAMSCPRTVKCIPSS